MWTVEIPVDAWSAWARANWLWLVLAWYLYAAFWLRSTWFSRRRFTTAVTWLITPVLIPTTFLYGLSVATLLLLRGPEVKKDPDEEFSRLVATVMMGFGDSQQETYLTILISRMPRFGSRVCRHFNKLTAMREDSRK
jgi:hypothetical protein